MVSNAQDALAGLYSIALKLLPFLIIPALLACGVEDDFAQDLIMHESDYAKVCNDPLNYLGDNWMEIDAAFAPANDGEHCSHVVVTISEGQL